ncbi:MAG: hypothetical protein IJU31_06840 [Synergistaceae bacterium]|nr:hypothetical protein [Synergistaceae bacterium]
MNVRKINNTCMRLQRWHEILLSIAAFEELLKPAAFHTETEIADLTQIRVLLFECQNIAKEQMKARTAELKERLNRR